MNEVEINVSEPQAAILESTAATNLFMAGVGSGKSHCIGIGSGDIIVNDPELIQFIGANTYQQLSKSTLKRVFDVWKELFGWVSDVDYVVDKIPPKGFKRFGATLKSYENTICFSNGAMLFTASLDNYKVIDGTEFAVAWLDETKDTKEEAVKEVISARLRQPGYWVDDAGTVYNRKHYAAYIKSGRWSYAERNGERILVDAKTLEQIRGWNPLYIFTSPAKVDWLNDWFELTDKYEEISRKIFSRTDFFRYENKERCVVISSTFHNEHNLADGYIAGLFTKYKNNPNLQEMLIYGSPIAKSGGEFASQFKRLEHVKKVDFIPGLPVHLSLDFNVAPYMTGICAQLTERDAAGRRKLRFFREYCLESPNNKVEGVASALAAEYGPRMRGLFFYGDPSGRARNSLTYEYKDSFEPLEKRLRKFLNSNSDRVLPNHPALIKSRDFLNNLLGGSYDIDVEIDESCKNLIHDMEYAKEDENGGMMKPKKKDPITGQTYEKYGHCLDAFRYLICSMFEKLYESS